MSICYCDYNGPEFYNKTNPVARKSHRCSECGSVINVDEEYERVTGMWDGYIDTFKTCSDCVEVRNALSEMECFCWSHGSLSEDVYNQMHEASFTPGERFSYLRVIAHHRIHKQE